MSRLALAMSTAPLSSAAMPTPEPPPETSTSTSGATLRYSSAHTWATFTIVSEPLFWITVLAGFAACWPPPPPHETRQASGDEPGAEGVAGRERGRGS